MRQTIRILALAIGGLFIAAAVLLWAARCTSAALGIGVPGLALTAAVLFERWRYKPLASRRPGPDWVATGERFVDPETGRLVTVFEKPGTGERRYVGG